MRKISPAAAFSSPMLGLHGGLCDGAKLLEPKEPHYGLGEGPYKNDNLPFAKNPYTWSEVRFQRFIEEYKMLTAICAATDYGDKSSVKKHNKSVDRMYEIVEAIGYKKTEETPEQFARLLNISDNKTNLWASIHILERIPIDSETEEKALDIIRTAAQGDSADAMGYQFWLNDWNGKNKK